MKNKLLLYLSFSFFLNLISLGGVGNTYANEDMSIKMADELYELGLFEGKSSTSYNPALKDKTSSVEAITLIGRALNWNIDKNVKSSFKDVPDWAVPYVEYAKKHGITSGVGHGKFGEEINGRRMLTWMLSALGENKEDVWTNIKKYSDKYNIKIPKTSLRSDIIYIIYEGIKFPYLGEKESLKEKIQKAFDSEIVEKLPNLPQKLVYTSDDDTWACNLSINQDGTFGIFYTKVDFKNVGPDYPKGTKYIAAYYGEFENIKRINKFEYSMEVKQLKEMDTPMVYIQDGIRILKTKPVGFSISDKLYYYLPGKLKSMLPEKYIDSGKMYWKDNAENKLWGCGLYNKLEEAGFYPGEKEIDDKNSAYK